MIQKWIIRRSHIFLKALTKNKFKWLEQVYCSFVIYANYVFAQDLELLSQELVRLSKETSPCGSAAGSGWAYYGSLPPFSSVSLEYYSPQLAVVDWALIKTFKQHFPPSFINLLWAWTTNWSCFDFPILVCLLGSFVLKVKIRRSSGNEKTLSMAHLCC